jgi:hypothetical protein
MKYLLLICFDPALPPTADEADPDAWAEETTTSGVRIEGHQLMSPSRAKTVRVRQGVLTKTDGPFAETKELLVGFDIIECADLDEAVTVAARHPVAGFGAVEVREFAD